MTIQSKLATIQKNLKVAKNQRNLFGNYNYRSCEDIMEAVKPLLDGCTLVISDEIVHFQSNHPSHIVKTVDSKGNDVYECVDGDRFYIKATATLSDGTDEISATAFARESQNKKGMDDSQITGSTSSYARKYALNGLFAIDDTKDADSMDNHKPSHKPQNTPVSGGKCTQCGTDGLPAHIVTRSQKEAGKVLCFTCLTKGATK